MTFPPACRFILWVVCFNTMRSDRNMNQMSLKDIHFQNFKLYTDLEKKCLQKRLFHWQSLQNVHREHGHFSTMTVSRKMIRELHWFISFKGRECVSRSFLSNKLILFHNENKIWKQDGTNTASSKNYDIVHSCFKKLLWIMRWSVLAQPSVESWTVLSMLR